MEKKVGFIGLGEMGEPMALNLVRSGISLLVWNRSSVKCDILKSAGADVATDVSDVFNNTDIVILMLANEGVIDIVLDRSGQGFSERIKNHIVINMGTCSAKYSKKLEADIQKMGGNYIEAPVSGSKIPAENAELVTMLAGDVSLVQKVEPIIQPLCKKIVRCGPVPNALSMKISVNLFLITMVTGLAETFHFAEKQGLDLNILKDILDAGPMASDVSKIKSAKICANDYSVQAAIADVFMNSGIVKDAAQQAGISAPLLDICYDLYHETLSLGFGKSDMIAVINAYRDRTDKI